MKIDESPHVEIYIIHLNCVSYLFLIKLSSSRKYIDILVIENATCCWISSHIQISNSAPSIILDIIFFTSGIKTLCVVTSNDENKSSLWIECCKVTSSKKEWTSVNHHLFGIHIFHHPITANIILMSTTDTENSTFICHNSPTEFRNIEVILQIDLMWDHFVHIIEMNILRAPFEIVHKLAWTVALFQYEGILHQLTELINNVNVRIISYSAREFPQLPFFSK